MSFSVISQKFLFWWVSKISLFFDNLAQKTRTPKTLGVSAHQFLKNGYASRNGHFWTKKTQIQKFQLSFFTYFLLFQQQKHKKCWNPYFYSVLTNPKKEDFQNLNLKHWKLKNPIFAPFFGKGLCLENCKIIGHNKKTQNDNWAKNRLKPLFL